MRVFNIFFLTLTAGVMSSGCYTTADDKSKFTLIPGRTDSVQRRYDKPVPEVMAAVRSAVSSIGTLTSEKKVPEGEMMKNVITGRIDTRRVWVTVRPDKEAPETISAVSFQVRTDSSFLVGGRNPDLQTAAALAEQTTLALIAAANPQPK